MPYAYLFVFIFITSLCAKEIKPVATLQASGLVSDFVEEHGLLYVATDAGRVDIIDLVSRKTINHIDFVPLHTAMGDSVPVRIHCIDKWKNKILMVTSSISAYREVWIYDESQPRFKKLTKIIDASKHLMPKRAFFTQKGKIVLGDFGSEVTLYDTQENYALYTRQVSESTMGGIALSKDKTKMITADESGIVRLIDINSSKVEKTFSSEHVDNIYAVAYSKGVIVTAGQDRRVGIYHKDHAFHIKSDFLVYCVGISPSAKTGIYSSGTEHDLQLFDTSTGKKLNTLVGHQAIPNKIMFITESLLISTGDEYTIYFWKI